MHTRALSSLRRFSTRRLAIETNDPYETVFRLRLPKGARAHRNGRRTKKNSNRNANRAHKKVKVITLS